MDKILKIGKPGQSVYGSPLYQFCDFSLCFKLCQMNIFKKLSLWAKKGSLVNKLYGRFTVFPTFQPRIVSFFEWLVFRESSIFFYFPLPFTLTALVFFSIYYCLKVEMPVSCLWIKVLSFLALSIEHRLWTLLQLLTLLVFCLVLKKILGH